MAIDYIVSYSYNYSYNLSKSFDVVVVPKAVSVVCSAIASLMITVKTFSFPSIAIHA